MFSWFCAKRSALAVNTMQMIVNKKIVVRIYLSFQLVKNSNESTLYAKLVGSAVSNMRIYTNILSYCQYISLNNAKFVILLVTT